MIYSIKQAISRFLEVHVCTHVDSKRGCQLHCIHTRRSGVIKSTVRGMWRFQLGRYMSQQLDSELRRTSYTLADSEGEAAVVRALKSNITKQGRGSHPTALLSAKPFYATELGAAYAGDALDLLKLLPAHCVNAIITSPPYALHFKKSYGNPSQAEYVDWFLGFAKEFRRVLRPKGSLVIEIGGAWNPGQPTRSVYHFELLVMLRADA